MKYLFVILPVLCYYVLGCESLNDESLTGANVNNAPVIHSVTASPSIISFGSGWSNVSCVATDADGDSITYMESRIRITTAPVRYQ